MGCIELHESARAVREPAHHDIGESSGGMTTKIHTDNQPPASS